MNLGINKSEAILIEWALDEFINNNKNNKNIWKTLFPDVDLQSIYTQLHLIELLETEEK